MTSQGYKRTDALAAAVLLLWAGMVLGFAFLMAPLLFSTLPSRDLAGMVAAGVVGRLDIAAFVAFGLATALVLLPRYMEEISDGNAVGPLRLWGATVLVAFLISFASAFIISPKLHTLRVYMDAPVETLAPESPLRTAYQKAHGISRQFMGLRFLLALGLAAGVSVLPRPKGQ